MLRREPEFSGNQLADAIVKVRRRITVNQWFERWITACNWIFATLILLAATLRFLRAPLVAGGIAIAVAAVVAGVRAWYLRPSAYEAAQRLDQASLQNDRLATAVYFWSASDRSPMLLRQREDAVDRIRKLDPERFFPIHMPVKMPWTAGLVVVLGVVCAFHGSHGPPLPALSGKFAGSRTFEAILAPLSQTLERTEPKQGGISLNGGTEDSKREPAHGRILPGSQSSLKSMRNGLASTANIPPQGAGGTPKGNLSGSNQNRDAFETSLSSSSSPRVQIQGPSPGESSQNRANQGGKPTAPGNKMASLASKALQSLDSLVQGALAHSSNVSANRLNGSQPASQQKQATSNAASQAAPGGPRSSGTATQPTQGNAGKGSDGTDISSTSNHTPLSGAGSAKSAWQTQANGEKLPLANTTPEHVPLESNGFAGPPGKDQANVGGGTAQVPLQDVAPPAVATVNGAGQDTVPTRYRQYVRDYFKQGKN